MFQQTGFYSIFSFILPIIFIFFKTTKLSNIFIVSATIYVFVGLFALLFLKDNYGSQKKISVIYKEVIHYCIHSKVLLFLIFVNIALYLYFTIFYYCWQPITLKIIVRNQYFPIFYGLYMIINVGSAYLVKFIDERNWKRSSVLVLFSYLFCFTSFYLANKFLNLSFIRGIATIFNVVLQFMLGRIVDFYGLRTLLLGGAILSAVLIFLLLIIKVENVSTANEPSSI